MPNNRNTDNQSEHLPLDSEDWEIALEPYEENPACALMLAFHLTVLKAYLDVEPLKIQEANEGIDRGLEVIFRYTGFHTVSYGLFRRLIQGKLTLEEEEILKKLGIKF